MRQLKCRKVTVHLELGCIKSLVNRNAVSFDLVPRIDSPGESIRIANRPPLITNNLNRAEVPLNTKQTTLSDSVHKMFHSQSY